MHVQSFWKTITAVSARTKYPHCLPRTRQLLHFLKNITLSSSQAKTISNKATQLSVTESQDQGAVEHSADQPRS